MQSNQLNIPSFLEELKKSVEGFQHVISQFSNSNHKEVQESEKFVQCLGEFVVALNKQGNNIKLVKIEEKEQKKEEEVNQENAQQLGYTVTQRMDISSLAKWSLRKVATKVKTQGEEFGRKNLASYGYVSSQGKTSSSVLAPIEVTDEITCQLLEKGYLPFFSQLVDLLARYQLDEIPSLGDWFKFKARIKYLEQIIGDYQNKHLKPVVSSASLQTTEEVCDSNKNEEEKLVQKPESLILQSEQPILTEEEKNAEQPPSPTGKETDFAVIPAKNSLEASSALDLSLKSPRKSLAEVTNDSTLPVSDNNRISPTNTLASSSDNSSSGSDGSQLANDKISVSSHQPLVESKKAPEKLLQSQLQNLERVVGECKKQKYTDFTIVKILRHVPLPFPVENVRAIVNDALGGYTHQKQMKANTDEFGINEAILDALAGKNLTQFKQVIQNNSQFAFDKLSDYLAACVQKLENTLVLKSTLYEAINQFQYNDTSEGTASLVMSGLTDKKNELINFLKNYDGTEIEKDLREKIREEFSSGFFSHIFRRNFELPWGKIRAQLFSCLMEALGSHHPDRVASLPRSRAAQSPRKNH